MDTLPWREALAGIGGAGRMALSMLAPWNRARRCLRGAGPLLAARPHPGDDLVPDPRWGWTHAIEVDAPAGEVWPWVAQVGADRGGFYSYAFLENLLGCRIRNAERVHPEWAAREGDALVLHPKGPPLRIVEVAPGRHLVAHGPADEAARRAGRPWIAVTWLFLVEDLGGGRSRVVSRYRCATSDDRRTRLAFGPALVEPIGSAMDRRMLGGIRERAERAARPPVAVPSGKIARRPDPIP
jgi:hypothetical protein